MAKRRTKAETAAFYNMTAPAQKTSESDEAYYKRLAAMADRRLERLEKETYNDPYTAGIKNFAFSNAMEDIRAFTGEESATRFRRALVKNADGSLNQKNLHMRLNAVKRFLESPSSTRRGMTKVQRTRTTSLNRNLGTNFSPKEAAAIFESEKYKEIAAQYGSKTALKAIGELKNNPDIEELQNLADNNIQVSEDEVVNDVIESLLDDGFTYDDLFDYDEL